MISFEDKGQRDKIKEWKQKKGLKSNSAAIRDMINHAYMELEYEKVAEKPGSGRPDLFTELNIVISNSELTENEGESFFLAMDDDERLHTSEDLLRYVVEKTKLEKEEAKERIEETFEWLENERVPVKEELEEIKEEANSETFSIPDDTCHICGKQKYSFGEELNYLAQHIQRAGGRHKEFLKEQDLQREDSREELEIIERWLRENRSDGSSKIRKLNFS